jgi:DNA-binding NarL/FixJ family response regulator
MAKQTTILLVDDHQIFRSGVRSLLQNEPSFEVVGEASNGRVAVELVRQLQPDVIVMDICMPELNGIDATRQALAIKPDTKIIALSAKVDKKTAIEMLSAGAAGYVAKDAAYEELVSAIRSVIEGRVHLTIPLMPWLISRAGGLDHLGSACLSMREREILQLISEGRGTKEIAYRLQVSIKTAETHRRNIMQKLNLDSIAGLTKYAIREGLTTIDG